MRSLWKIEFCQGGDFGDGEDGESGDEKEAIATLGLGRLLSFDYSQGRE